MKTVHKIWQKAWKSNKPCLQVNGMNKAYLAYLNRLLVRELKQTSEDQEDIQCWSRCGCRTAVGVFVGERHVAEEVVDVGEEVLVGEDVVLMGVRDEELASSRVERSPKTLSPFSRTGSQEIGFRRPTVLAHGARRKTGWGRL
jgi:hypothetical protein